MNVYVCVWEHVCNFLGRLIVIYLLLCLFISKQGLKPLTWTYGPPAPISQVQGLQSWHHAQFYKRMRTEHRALSTLVQHSPSWAASSVGAYFFSMVWTGHAICDIWATCVVQDVNSDPMIGSFYSLFCLMSRADSDLSRVLTDLFLFLRTQRGLLVDVWLQSWCCCWLPHLQRVGLEPGKSPVLEAELTHFSDLSWDTDTHLLNNCRQVKRRNEQ